MAASQLDAAELIDFFSKQESHQARLASGEGIS
jgi:hypothetical protein